MNDLHNGYYDIYQVLLFSKLTDDNLSLNQQSVLSALERWLDDTLPGSIGLPTEVKEEVELVLSSTKYTRDLAVLPGNLEADDLVSQLLRGNSG
ncbi:MAG: hypothetical protein L3J47_00350 [Sulfurovum sp.]|nr:hypothetical protein [Sulfurovum sp.]